MAGAGENAKADGDPQKLLKERSLNFLPKKMLAQVIIDASRVLVSAAAAGVCLRFYNEIDWIL